MDFDCGRDYCPAVRSKGDGLKKVGAGAEGNKGLRMVADLLGVSIMAGNKFGGEFLKGRFFMLFCKYFIKWGGKR